MPAYDLRLSSSPQRLPNLGTETFLWAVGNLSSIDSNLDPRLLPLGPVPRPNIEFVRLAVAVYAADRSTLRRGGGSNWSQREITVTVPVWDPARWQPHADELAGILGFLSGDQWELRFRREPGPAATEDRATVERIDRAVLLSGGADSLTGAILSRTDLREEPYALVSHFSWSNLAPIQVALARDVEASVAGGPQRHVQIRLRRHATQPGSGVAFPDEFSSRSRSLLFIALGLAVASVDAVSLWVPENGFTSLNPPLSPERRGSLSTRTTHPRFIEELSRVLTGLGAHAALENPFFSSTKGEMFAELAAQLGKDVASGILSKSHSCAHTGGRASRFPATAQCGVCYGCLVRRAAFIAAGIEDKTGYILEGPASDARDRYLARKSAVPAVRYFVERGVSIADVAALSLPASVSAAAVLDICNRAANELRAVCG